VLWLHERTGNPKLLQLARLLHQQGYDWQKSFEHFDLTEKTDKHWLGTSAKDRRDKIRPMAAHGVNNAMGLKHSPVWCRLTRAGHDRRAFHEQLGKLDQFHGLPNGLFSADGHLAGRNPSQGTELCTVVEMMYSLEQAFAVLGDVAIADRLEKVAFNALPGTLTDDMWAGGEKGRPVAAPDEPLLQPDGAVPRSPQTPDPRTFNGKRKKADRFWFARGKIKPNPSTILKEVCQEF